MSDDKRIGRFRLGRELSHNPTGRIVYHAFDDDRNRQVSIEVLHEHTPPEQADAFFVQARSFSKLKHPNLVRCFDYGRTDEGRYYMVSELIEGFTLRERVRKTSLTYDDTARMLATIAQALHHVHENGLIHGNLHLGNISLEADTGKPYVTGFGLPYRENDGMTFGNPSHVSPEQVRGDIHLLDGRSDVYSLGIMLYELLTGKRPFQGNISELINQITSVDAVPPRKLNGDIPVELDRICLKTLAKRASDRYSTASELAADLVRWQSPPMWRWLPRFMRR
jgi:serine/threonine protein kinase